MSASQSPVICVTCQRPFEPELKQKEAPRYFAQYMIMPRSDGDSDFASEVQTILGYIQAVASATRSAKEIGEDTYHTLLDFIQDLAEEATRRNDLALKAMDEIWKRPHDPETGTEYGKGATS